jgi:hypothetical protein
MPRGGDGAARRTALLGMECRVTRSVALAQQRAQATAINTLTPPLVASMGASSTGPENIARHRDGGA